MSAAKRTPPAKAEIYAIGTAPESRAERVRRMQATARSLAREEIQAMKTAMAGLARMAGDVAAGGEAYPVGIREIASRLGRELEAHSKSVEVLLMRS